MFDKTKSGSTRSAGLRGEPTSNSAPSAVKQSSPAALLDAQFHLLQKECAQTLSLLKQLRAAPLDRPAAVAAR